MCVGLEAYTHCTDIIALANKELIRMLAPVQRMSSSAFLTILACHWYLVKWTH